MNCLRPEDTVLVGSYTGQFRKEFVMKCIKCGSINLDVVKSGPHNKLVCVDCLAFQKFLNEVDTRTFLALQAKTKEATS